jgi:general secretion pathway protein A
LTLEQKGAVKQRSEPFDNSLERHYLEHFGFSGRPFGLTPDPAFYFESRSHGEAMARLNAFLSRKERLALVFGDVGTGKTVLSRHFLASLDERRFSAGLVVNPIISETEFLSEVIKGPGNGRGLIGHGQPERQQQHSFHEERAAAQSVLAIDEAQHLSDEVLRFISDLVSSETGDQKTLRVVLFGQEELLARLLDPGLKDVRQRIVLTHRLQPLAEDEVASYVAHRLSKAGARNNVRFTDSAMDVLFIHSEGYPRIINTLCDLCLLFLSSRSGTIVDRQVVRQVLKGMAAGQVGKKSGNGRGNI